jgi:RasGEF domain
MLAGTEHWCVRLTSLLLVVHHWCRPLPQFIDIAMQLRKISNFSGMMQVLSSLNNSCISRLHQSWRLVDEKLLENFNDLNSLMVIMGRKMWARCVCQKVWA